MLTKSNPFELLVDSHHGQYVPQVFAEIANRDLFGETISAEDWAILEAGPDHEHYWDCWDDVLNSAETEDSVSLWQDGDLWAVNWAVIGTQDDIADIGAMAYAQLIEIEGTKELIGELYSALIDGPSAGRWSQELLSELRERVEQIADRVSDQLPIYYQSDFGIAERDFDVEKMLIDESGYLKAISDYW